MIKDILKDRARYSETDQMGLVHHSNYARFYENGRSKLMRELGLPYAEIEAMGIVMPVISVESKFIKPLFYDENYTVETRVNEMPGAKLKTNYLIYNQNNELIHEGTVVLGFMNLKTRKVCRPPEAFTSIFSTHFATK